MFPGLRMPKGDFLRETFMKNYEFWFIVGSQTLYGPEVLETVDARAREMAAYLTERLPYPLVYKGTAKSAEEISAVVREANYQEKCCGLVTWCHTFSPSKMWINGLEVLRKPYCHFVTQYNRDRYGFHEPEPGGAWRPGAWFRGGKAAPAAENHCGLLAKPYRGGAVGPLDANGDWRCRVQEHEGHAFWRQYAGCCRDRGR